MSTDILNKAGMAAVSSSEEIIPFAVLETKTAQEITLPRRKFGVTDLWNIRKKYGHSGTYRSDGPYRH